MRRAYYTLDVFTDQVLTGNPLAVVLDSEGLDDEMMQRIAAEFNLSETVFVLPPENEENHASIRIYTPVHELPFAGHPTVGTAILFSHLDKLFDGSELVLEEQIGPVLCEILGAEDVRSARFQLPKVSQRIDWEYDADKLASAIGLSKPDFGFDNHEISIWDAGVPYMLVPLSSIDAVKNISINNLLLKEVEPVINGIHANVYAYCRGGENKNTSFHARMFAPFQGIPEDPATGSAAASFSGQIAANEMDDTQETNFIIEQGFEMGRPSRIELGMHVRDGKLVSATIGGSAVIVSKGELFI